MTYYLYIVPGGFPDITNYELDLSLFPGYTLHSTSETPIVLPGNRFVDGQWVWENATPEYAVNRKKHYPDLGDQFDMLWHAMDDGTIPKIEPLYSQIKAVKEQFPKP